MILRSEASPLLQCFLSVSPYKFFQPRLANSYTSSSVGFAACSALRLVDHNLGLRRGYDGANYLILNIEKLSKLAVKPISPNVRTSGSLDQLRGNPHAVPHSPHAALDDIPNAKFLSDLLHIHRAAFVGERGVSCDDEKAFEPRHSVMMSS